MRASRFLGVTIPALTIAACSGASESTLTTTGPIEVRAINSDTSALVATTAVDPNLGTLTKIVVSISRVDAKIDVDADDHKRTDDAWITVATGPITLDLLSLEGSSFASLGVGLLPAGNLDSLRLVLAPGGPDYVVKSDGSTVPLVVPSGDEAGILVTGDFDAPACAAGHVTLEFAGRHSIVVRQDADGDAFLLRPVIHLREVVVSGDCDHRDEDGHPGHAKGAM